jgi:hypothetical protein
MKPSTWVTSARVQRVILGWARTEDIFGVRMQAEQSSVGNVLSNLAMWPPMVASRSTRKTFLPALARVRAAWMPAMPPPTTSTSGRMDTRWTWSGLWNRTR